MSIVIEPPELVIIAGPNGAGKSTTNLDILFDLGIKSFDFDLEFYSAWKRFGYDPGVENGVKAFVSELFEERKQEAISSRTSFSFETNYNSSEVLTTVDEFKKAGFLIELVFIILDTPEIAIDRVNDRVLKGGHFVDEETIRRRFYDGLDLLDSTFMLFDVVSIYISRTNLISSAILIEPGRNKVELFNPLPESISVYLPKIKSFVDERK
ncbi:MAG TPA: zeta toxin family protein [Cyclobacteriaceae bacterium]|nr:zeta toxin family protein [Cyclobacteriaceae bacterium]